MYYLYKNAIIVFCKEKITFNTEIIIPYKEPRHPHKVAREEFLHNPEAGCNCQLLVYALTEIRGFEIPSHFRSSELYEDDEYTEEISLEQADTGDIFGFWYAKEKGPRYIHLGLAWKDTDKMKIVHNSKRIGEMVIEPLSEVRNVYNDVDFVKRPRVFAPSLKNDEILDTLGLDFFK